MKVGSLFAGIGGLDLGLERAGMQVRWQVEIDGYCRKVLAKHWPDVKRYEDVRKVGAHNLEAVDLICGGFPCQDISTIGTLAGIKGKQSGLWSEFYRTIRELRPRYVLVENVPGLLVRGINRVLGDLAGGGYDAEWETIPAAAFGATHRRNRIFIVAYPAPDAGEGAAHLRESWSGVFAGEPRGVSGLEISSAHWQTDQPPITEVDDGLPDWPSATASLGNAVVPQVAEWIGRRIIAAQ